MTRTLCAIFFLSGTAALIFETLWFRQAGITSLRNPVLWYFGSDEDRQRILSEQSEPALEPATLAYLRAADALASREYLRAAAEFGNAQRAAPDADDLRFMPAFSLCLAGRSDLLSAEMAKAACPSAVRNEDE